jgi:PadR family transcriptional regulator, regulatory protein AphA
MKKINKTRYAILGMIIEKPSSGYEIRQSMLGSTQHFWQETDASIYPMLRILEAEGLVKAKSEFVGKRERRIFEITQAGKDEFSSWLALPAESENHRNELLLKLFFGANTTKEENLKQFYLKLERCKEIKRTFKNIQENVITPISDENPNKLYWMLTLRNGIIRVAAEIQWIEECINILEKDKKWKDIYGK